jgi:hypothetical protein
MDEKFAARVNHRALADQPRNLGHNSEEQSGYCCTPLIRPVRVSPLKAMASLSTSVCGMHLSPRFTFPNALEQFLAGAFTRCPGNHNFLFCHVISPFVAGNERQLGFKPAIWPMSERIIAWLLDGQKVIYTTFQEIQCADQILKSGECAAIKLARSSEHQF